MLWMGARARLFENTRSMLLVRTWRAGAGWGRIRNDWVGCGRHPRVRATIGGELVRLRSMARVIKGAWLVSAPREGRKKGMKGGCASSAKQKQQRALIHARFGASAPLTYPTAMTKLTPAFDFQSFFFILSIFSLFLSFFNYFEIVFS